MGKSYVGDIGTEIILDCGSDISAATEKAIVVRLPDDNEVSWSAEFVAGEPTKIKHVTVAGDLAQPGLFRLQAEVTVPGWSGRGETVALAVYDKFK